jgi:hypothetical protein
MILLIFLPGARESKEPDAASGPSPDIDRFSYLIHI